MPFHQGLHYVDAVEGPAVIFLHAFPLDHRLWLSQIEVCKRAGYRAIAPDLPGLGRSKAALRNDLSLWAEHLIALLDHLEIPQATVIGLSLGGYLAQALYQKAPERFSRLALADTKASADAPAGKQARNEMIELANQFGQEAIAQQMILRLLAPETINDKRTVVEATLQMMLQNPVSGIIGALEALRDRPDFTDLLPQITVPTLLLFGESDQATPVSEGEKMRECLPNAELVVIPNAGHLSNLENTEAFNQSFLKFLPR